MYDRNHEMMGASSEKNLSTTILLSSWLPVGSGSSYSPPCNLDTNQGSPNLKWTWFLISYSHYFLDRLLATTGGEIGMMPQQSTILSKGRIARNTFLSGSALRF